MAVEEATEIFFLKFIRTDLHETTDNPPHHPPQKMRRLDSKLNDVFLGLDRGTFNDDDCGFVGPSGIRRAETNKVVTTGQQCCRAAHGVDIERFLYPPYGLFGKSLFARGNLIDVAARHRIVSSVKRTRHGLNPEHHDIGGQEIVQASLHFPGRDSHLPIELDVNDLAKGMDAGIGSAGRLYFGVLLKHRRRSFAQFSQQSARILLFLRTAVARPVVFEKQFESVQAFSLWIG